ncbi:hypothetical protein E4U54_006253 [Claviceps lovelessii]|nr:hypothetical protein E4U54_006253 [Claviceps lovelessii]
MSKKNVEKNRKGHNELIQRACESKDGDEAQIRGGLNAVVTNSQQAPLEGDRRNAGGAASRSAPGRAFPVGDGPAAAVRRPADVETCE